MLWTSLWIPAVYVVIAILPHGYQLLPDFHPTLESHLFFTYASHTQRLKIHQEERAMVTGCGKNVNSKHFSYRVYKAPETQGNRDWENQQIISGPV